MALWSLLATLTSDSGYIPLNYELKVVNLNQLTRAIFKRIIEFAEVNIAPAEGPQSQVIKKLRLMPQYEFKLPKIRGDNTIYTGLDEFRPLIESVHIDSKVFESANSKVYEQAATLSSNQNSQKPLESNTTYYSFQ